MGPYLVGRVEAPSRINPLCLLGLDYVKAE